MLLEQANEIINNIIKGIDLNNKFNHNFVEILHNMKVHIDGIYPNKLIEERRPFEDENIWNYRKKNYEPLTLGLFRKALNSIHRIFNNDKYQIILSDDLNKANLKFENLTIIDYVKDYIISNMITDPNGLLVVLPRYQVINDVPTVLIENKKPIIDIHYIESSRILFESKEVLIYTNEIFENKTEFANNVSEITIIDKDSVFKYYRDKKGKFVGNKVLTIDNRFYPFIKLGGIWLESKKCFDSYFSAAAGFGNEFIKHYSDWYGLMTTCGHPVREIRRQRCETCKGCKVVHDETCSNCNGSGLVSGSSPYGVYYQEDYNPALDASEVAATKAPVIWHSPDIAPLENYQQAYEKMYLSCEKALGLDKTNEVQSGIAKTIDKEDVYSMYMKISDNVFRIIERIYDLIESYRNPQSFVKPVVIKPTSFDMRSETDLINEIKLLKESQAPANVLKEVYRELFRKRYAGNMDLIMMYDFLIDSDPLFTMTAEEKALLLNLNLINKEDVIYSLNASNILSGLIVNEKNKKEFYSNKDTLKARITALLPTTIQTSLL